MLKITPALVKILCSSWDILEIKKTAGFYIHTNTAFQISQELKRIFKIAVRFLSLTKVLSEIPLSKNSHHTETSQSTSHSNQSLFSDLRSILDLQKIHYIDWIQTKSSISFVFGTWSSPELFFPTEKLVSLY